MSTTVFGANGPTGRLVVEQALAAGERVTAVTRRPHAFPCADRSGLTVIGADVLDRTPSGRARLDAAVDGAEAVISTLGVPYRRGRIEVYSAGVAAVTAAMQRRGVRRLVVVSSGATYPRRHARAGWVFNRLVQPMIVATIGRSLYADMRRMEEAIRIGDRDWTIVRPNGLFDHEVVTGYRIDDEHSEWIFTARSDLAHALRLVTADEYVGRTVAVTTTQVRPSLIGMMRREALSTAS